MAEKTTEQIKTEFLDYLWKLIDRHSSDDPEVREQLKKTIFSILSYLDGTTSVPLSNGKKQGIPQFIMAPNPHPDDKAFCIKEGLDYYPQNSDDEIRGNICGELHDDFFGRDPKKNKPPDRTN